MRCFWKPPSKKMNGFFSLEWYALILNTKHVIIKRQARHFDNVADYKQGWYEFEV